MSCVFVSSFFFFSYIASNNNQTRKKKLKIRKQNKRNTYIKTDRYIFLVTAQYILSKNAKRNARARNPSGLGGRSSIIFVSPQRRRMKRTWPPSLLLCLRKKGDPRQRIHALFIIWKTQEIKKEKKKKKKTSRKRRRRDKKRENFKKSTGEEWAKNAYGV